MSKFYIIFICGWLGCVSSNTNLLAQNLEFELVFRPALTSLRGNDMVEKHLDPAIYPSGGVGLTSLFANRSLINVGVLYEIKGGRKEDKIVFRDTDNQPVHTQLVKTNADFQYITIPIQWGKRFGGKVQYQLGMGIYSSFLLKQETSTEYDGYAGSFDLTDSYKDIDIGVSASFSVYFPLKKSWLLKAAVDDYLGVFDTMKSDIDHEGSTKHNSLGIIVGLNYRLQKTK